MGLLPAQLVLTGRTVLCHCALCSLLVLGCQAPSAPLPAAPHSTSMLCHGEQVRSRFADGAGGKEDFGPFLACLKQLGFKLVDQDASNRMFVVMVLRKKGNAPAALSPAPAAALPWPALRACVYKKR